MKRVILCPNPYRDSELTVAKRSRELLEGGGGCCIPGGATANDSYIIFHKSVVLSKLYT